MHALYHADIAVICLAYEASGGSSVRFLADVLTFLSISGTMF